jgi:hypothetical protein
MASNAGTVLLVAPASRRLFGIVSKVQKLPARRRRYKTETEAARSISSPIKDQAFLKNAR